MEDIMDEDDDGGVDADCLNISAEFGSVHVRNGMKREGRRT